MINEHLQILAEDLSGLMDIVIVVVLVVIGIAGKIFNSMQAKKQQEKIASQPKPLTENNPENIETTQAQNKPRSIIAEYVEKVRKAYEEQIAQQQPQQQTKAVAQPPETIKQNILRSVIKDKLTKVPAKKHVARKPDKIPNSFDSMDVPAMAGIAASQIDPKTNRAANKTKKPLVLDLLDGSGKDLKKAFIYYEVFSKPLSTRQQNIF